MIKGGNLKKYVENNLDSPVLFMFGINHKTAPVEIREKLYIQESELPEILDVLCMSLDECVITSTCNRTEVFCVSNSPDFEISYFKDLLLNYKNATDAVELDHFFELSSCPATRHLFQVVTSLDSKVIGDSQILGQVRQAYSIAQSNGSTGKVLNQLFQRALMVGKRTFTETPIHKGAVSVSMAAVELANEVYGDIKGRSVLIIGAGETAQLTAECLIKQKVGSLLVTNRTYHHAKEMADHLASKFDFPCETVPFASFKDRLNSTDIVISSTSSPDPILLESNLSSQTNQILLVDIAVPRDIDENVVNNPHVTLKNIDDLNAALDTNHQKRLDGIPAANQIISKELGSFLMWYYALPLMHPSINGDSDNDEHGTRTAKEMIKIKTFLNANADEFHKLAMLSGCDFQTELKYHSQLVERLRSARYSFEEALAAGNG